VHNRLASLLTRMPDGINYLHHPVCSAAVFKGIGSGTLHQKRLDSMLGRLDEQYELTRERVPQSSHPGGQNPAESIFSGLKSRSVILRLL